MKYLLIIFFAASSIFFAQELNCTVTVNLQSIPPSSRDNLSGFQSSVENYINQLDLQKDGRAIKSIAVLRFYF